ncbi:glycosyltransferase [Pleurocapsales cyanobacterium LEGE 06147]|nr:glycosyltransferase [Pleurocapsales cyanobacterium LEGE 06147]
MKKQLKIVLIFNGNLLPILEEWKQEGNSAHHLWGATELHKYGIDVEILPYEKYSFLKWISNRLKFLGDLDLQLRVFLARERYDAVYCAHQMTVSLLTFLRLINLFNKPMVGIAHRSFQKSLLSQLFITLFVRGNDKLLCLNEKTKNHLRDEFKIPEKKLGLLHWCIDIKALTTQWGKM